MDKFDRIFALHELFDAHRRPLGIEEIAEALECSKPTAKRAISTLRRTLGAPIDYQSDARGYVYKRSAESPHFQLPGLWFRADELRALFMLRALVSSLEPGLLREHLAPLSRRLDELFEHGRLRLGEAAERLRFFYPGSRAIGRHFKTLASATLERRRLDLVYRGRARDEETRREVSPLRLTFYRGSWYLDAWCHLREGVRHFAVERVIDARPLDKQAREVGSLELDGLLGAAYGIFSGPATERAVLAFSPERARWVAEERWHPGQEQRWREDGRFELTIPYAKPDELVLDILRFGPEVEVLAPESLRRVVAERLRAAAALYQERRGQSAALVSRRRGGEALEAREGGAEPET